MTDLFGNEEPKAKSEIETADKVITYIYSSHKIRTGKLEDGTEVWVVTDVISAVTYSKDPQHYWYVVKKRMQAEGNEDVTNCYRLKIKTDDGKMRDVEVMTRTQLLRMLETLPSKKAEPFRMWIARLANERIEEIQNPEKGIDNAVEAYRRQGKSDKWIRERLKGKAKFITMTDALKSHGAENYAVLIDEQHRHAFNLSIKDHKALKRIEEKGSLRDGMNEWELFVQEAADTASKWLLDEQEAEGQSDCKKSMADGGDLAATLRLGMEAKLGRKVIDAIDYRKITA